ncbi:hypothetical protein A7K91_05670 [Paenibacillus oryzae]|uniref:Major facilitator superfamily (MFS) profile domain-containing protein n=2 Tax=Paenibacillus oryzae TaxID=1844972 RepID=A0A1A5YHK0_9BACL|nr:hypothetical protein A7K91_05670 [Paenibacillus oryzae]
MALLGAAWSPNATMFLASSLLIGLGSVVAQVLVPFAAYLAPEDQRGRVVGKVMSGLLLGIMLARPVASLVADEWGWRPLFMGSAAVSALLAVLLISALPERQPSIGSSYGKLLASLWTLLKETPVLRRRALCQASLFGAFSLFWTAAPLYLSDAYGLSQKGIAFFALVGVGGAAAAPIVGRYADRGLIRPLTFAALLTAVFGWGLSVWIGCAMPLLALLLFLGEREVC